VNAQAVEVLGVFRQARQQFLERCAESFVLAGSGLQRKKAA
jgi:hypothetical protein